MKNNLSDTTSVLEKNKTVILKNKKYGKKIHLSIGKF